MSVLDEIVDDAYVVVGKKGGSGRKGLYLTAFAEIMADGVSLSKVDIAKALLKKIVDIKIPEFDENSEEMVIEARDLARKIKDQVNALVSQSKSNSCYSFNDNYPGIVVESNGTYSIDEDGEYVAPEKKSSVESEDLVDEMIADSGEEEIVEEV